MADIYGSQNKVLLQDGLADAINSVDFQAKLSSLKPVWNGIVPGFHRWLEKNCAAIFMECLTLEAREKHGISTCFTTNVLEAMHCLQKKTLTEDDVPKEIVSISKSLRRWVMTLFSKARQAIRGLGKCRLSKAFEDFFVEPTKWVQWLDKQHNQHFAVFMNAKPKAFVYEKPGDADKKPGNAGKSKQRIRLPELTMFSYRVSKDSTDLPSEPNGNTN